MITRIDLSDVDLTFLWNGIVNLLVSFFVVIICLFIGLSIRKSKKINLNNRKSISKIVVWIFVGFVIGLIEYFINYISHQLNYEFFPMTTIGVIWISSVFISPFLIIGGFIPFLSIIVIEFMANYVFMIWLLIILYCFITLIVLASSYIGATKTYLQFIYQIIFFIFASLLVWSTTPIDMQLNNFLSLAFLFIFDVIAYFIGFFIKKAFDKTENLSNKAIYENNYFINNNFAKNEIKKSIDVKNTRIGYIVIFKFVDLEKQLFSVGKKITNSLLDEIGKKIVESVENKNIIFFKTKNNDFACFITTNQNVVDLNILYKASNNDYGNNELTKYANIFDNLPKKINYNNQTIYLGMKGFVSIYGVHSCDIDELIDKCDIFANSYDIKRDNFFQFFDHKKASSDPLFSDYLSLMNVFDTNEIIISLVKSNAYSFNDKKNIIIVKPSYFYLKKFMINKNKIYDLVPFEYRDVFVAHLSARSLKEFSYYKNNKTQKILLDFPLSRLNKNDFSLSLLLKKINLYEIKPEQIILNFDIGNEFYDLLLLKDNFMKIKNANIGISFCNVNELNLNLINQIKPDFIRFEKIMLNCGDSKKMADKYYLMLWNFARSKKINVLCD